MSIVYSTTVTSVGGRDGTICGDDGMLDLKIALPQSLGVAWGATNPEQLIAAGYVAGFANAVKKCDSQHES
jgi:lipoyl-dependent peroxiredoxin